MAARSACLFPRILSNDTSASGSSSRNESGPIDEPANNADSSAGTLGCPRFRNHARANSFALRPSAQCSGFWGGASCSQSSIEQISLPDFEIRIVPPHLGSGLTPSAPQAATPRLFRFSKTPTWPRCGGASGYKIGLTFQGGRIRIKISLTLAHRSKGIGRDLARLELPLSTDFGVLVVIPPRHQPLLPVPQHTHFHITGPFGPVRTQ